jgi:ATP-binding cassette subfamily E protein 1
MTLLQDADIYVFDEPCPYLDIKKRFAVARLLRARATGEFGNEPDDAQKRSVLVIDHDLLVLDFMCDTINIFYGNPYNYGVISPSLSVRTGLNQFLEGVLKSSNLQFREFPITFETSGSSSTSYPDREQFLVLPNMKKSYAEFTLSIRGGTIMKGEIIGVIGENACGKSTFAKILAGEVTPDEISAELQLPTISYKPQYLTLDHEGPVGRHVLNEARIDYSIDEDTGVEYYYSDFARWLIESLGIDRIWKRPVRELSGGQLQRTYLCAALLREAELYIIDEPAAYLDIEERLHLGSIIKKAIRQRGASALCVEHDLQICDVLADRFILFEGRPGILGTLEGPLEKHEGMNRFLQTLDITFRRDETTGRSRVNTPDSRADRTQKSTGQYFYEYD